MKIKDAEPLALGPDAIQKLIPHRRPLLMVDRVLAYRHAPKPTLYARRQISANEPIFDGHFPGYALWPGVYTIEGLGQTTLLCAIIAVLIGRTSQGEVLDGLRKLERGTVPQALVDQAPKSGMAGHVDIKFMQPVMAGCELHYTVTMTHVVDQLARFDVLAEVDGVPVARGTMTGMIGS